jgi:hypothetical protein
VTDEGLNCLRSGCKTLQVLQFYLFYAEFLVYLECTEKQPEMAYIIF